MGLIRAAAVAASGVMKDQWKEFFYCDALPADVLAVRGQKRVTGFSSNKGNDNIISNGSIIAVADGQCMMIVEQGDIVDLCAEPGEYKYDASSEPSLLDGGKLGKNIKAVFANIGKRFTFGGQAPKDQRVYYFNTKEIIGNKYGTPSPVPFRVVDQRAGIDMDIALRCFGEYSYRITNPMLFYKNVCGNITQAYTRNQLDSQLKSELLTALQPAFARISEMGIRYSAIPGHTTELANALREELSADWSEHRGIEIQRIGVSSIKANEEDEKLIKQMQQDAAYMDTRRAAAYTVRTDGQAKVDAANNPNGAAAGFIGMNMASGMGGGKSAADLFAIAAQEEAAAAARAAQAQAAAAAKPAADSWTCPSCGQQGITGKFCPECGAKRPVAAPAGHWICACGATNKGKFCSECGAKKPAGIPQYKCDKCGWEPADPTKPPKFCPECGDPFDDGDIV